MEPARNISHNGNNQPRNPCANPSDNKKNSDHAFGTHKRNSKELLQLIDHQVAQALKNAGIKPAVASMRDPAVALSHPSENKVITIKEISRKDVLTGKNFKPRARREYPGNVQFRKALSELCGIYVTYPNTYKSKLAQSIITHMNAANRRFIDIKLKRHYRTDMESHCDPIGDPIVLSERESRRLLQKTLRMMHKNHINKNVEFCFDFPSKQDSKLIERIIAVGEKQEKLYNKSKVSPEEMNHLLAMEDN